MFWYSFLLKITRPHCGIIHLSSKTSRQPEIDWLNCPPADCQSSVQARLRPVRAWGHRLMCATCCWLCGHSQLAFWPLKTSRHRPSPPVSVEELEPPLTASTVQSRSSPSAEDTNKEKKRPLNVSHSGSPFRFCPRPAEDAEHSSHLRPGGIM